MFNVKIKEYKDGDVKLIKYKNPIHEYKLTELEKNFNKIKRDEDKVVNPFDNETISRMYDVEDEFIKKQKSVIDSVRRTKQKIYDYAKSNDNWEWFLTLTFDREIVDVTDLAETHKYLKRFLDNVKKNYAPGMKYLIVAELHEDKKSYHYHGLLSDVGDLELVQAINQNKKSRFYGMPIEDVYNVLNWKVGYSTLSKVKDSKKASSYIIKYITKDLVENTKGISKYKVSKNIDKVKETNLYIDNEVEIQGIINGFSSKKTLYKIKQSKISIPNYCNEVTYYDYIV